MVVDDAGGGGGLGVDDVVGALAGDAHGLAQVVVKSEVGAGHVGQVGGDVAGGDGDLAVLHVLGVHELDVVDHVEFVEQHGADQAVEVAAGDEAVFLLRHDVFCSFPGLSLNPRIRRLFTLLQTGLKINRRKALGAAARYDNVLSAGRWRG